MTSALRPDPEAAKTSWDAYWQVTGDVGAWTAGGVAHPAMQGFWTSVFEKALNEKTDPRVLDIGSGNGALVVLARQVFRSAPLHITCVDISQSAIDDIQRRFPEVEGRVCDAAEIPIDSGRFDLICSQFGIEYAGMSAVDEAVRLLAPSGRLALLMHHSGGIIQSDCEMALEAVSAVQNAAFVPLALEMFRAGFEAVKGADRAPYDEAASRLQPAVSAVEAVLSKYGENIAGGTIARLYQDVSKIHSKLPNYEPDEVLGWLKQMEEELAGFVSRMQSMMGSALDESGFESVCQRLLGRNLAIEESGPLFAPGQPSPLGWVVIATAP